jgi:hypothetical protein
MKIFNSSTARGSDCDLLSHGLPWFSSALRVPGSLYRGWSRTSYNCALLLTLK